MAAITICSDFGAPKNKVWHCFPCFSIYFPWSDGTRCHDLSFLILKYKKGKTIVLWVSVQFSCSVMSDSLGPHGLQHTRLPCPSPTPGVYSNSCPSSWRCHPTISSSVIPFSSFLQAFPVSGSFPISQFFASSGQSIGASASASVLSMSIQDWFPSGLTGWISLQSSPIPQFESINSSVLSFLYGPTLTSLPDYWKNHSLD